MRLLVALIIIIYLIGVGVVLSPIIRSGWSSEPKLSLGRIDRLYRPAPLCGRYRPSNGRAFFRMDVAAVDRPARPIAHRETGVLADALWFADSTKIQSAGSGAKRQNFGPRDHLKSLLETIFSARRPRMAPRSNPSEGKP